MLKVAMIGFGGIAHAAHINPLLELQASGRIKLVAICDVRPEVFDEKVEINIGGGDVVLDDSTKRYTDWKQMLETEEIDVVHVCVPTFLHEEITISALESGHHVLCEKPMSLKYEECKRMYEAAEKANKKLMIGQVVRFDGGRQYIKKLIDDKTYGKVMGATFQRLSPPPQWSWENWYMNYERSRGCIMDLHVHDIDYIRYIFGEPESVSCCTANVFCGNDIVHSRLMYKDFSVMAIADWTREGFQFESGYTIAFEKATVVVTGQGMTICPRGEENFNPTYDRTNSYKKEIFYFMDVVENKIENTINPPEGSAITIKLVNALEESASKNGEFIPFSAN